jgi:hypothetical protein
MSWLCIATTTHCAMRRRVMDPLEHAVEIRLVRNDPPLDLVAEGELQDSCAAGCRTR